MENEVETGILSLLKYSGLYGSYPNRGTLEAAACGPISLPQSDLHTL